MSNVLMQVGNGQTGIEQIPYSQAVNNPLGEIGNRFILANQIASTLSAATLIPDHLRGERKKVNGEWQLIAFSPEQVRANVLMVVNRALQWGVDPIALISESFVVGGKLDFQGKVIAAVVNALGGLRNNLTFTYTGNGEDLVVTVAGTLKSENAPRTINLSYRDAVTKDGQGRVNEQWKKDVESKLAYSGAKKWARRHAPGVVLGLFAEDEDEPITINVTTSVADLPRKNITMDGYEERIAASDNRDDLTALVNKIKSEPLEILDEAEVDYLRSIAKHRFRNLPAATKVEGQKPTEEVASSDDRILQYEAGIAESASADEVQRWVSAIDADPHLSTAEIKSLGKCANDRVKRGF